MEYINNMTIPELVAIIVSVEAAAKFVFEYLNKLYKIRQNEDKETETIEDLKQKVEDLSEKIKEDENNIQLILEVLKMQCRFYLVDSCLDAIKHNKIQATKLQSIKDLYAIYHKIGGNEYVSGLVERAETVEIED